MKRPTRHHDTLVYRLSEVLTKLNQGDSLDPKALADEFGVNRRTIQRDLNVRFAGFASFLVFAFRSADLFAT